ncbi:MAG: hypothetical protein KH501_08695 [Eubacterium limosum]|nr:hypothetical protein [Eubacterium limosum]
MEKERKSTVLLMLGGIVFMILMDAAGRYLVGAGNANLFLRVLKKVLIVIQWGGLGFGLGLLARGVGVRSIGLSKAYLLGALTAFLMSVFFTKLVGMMPQNTGDWFVEMNRWAASGLTSWFLAIGGLLLFLGLTVGREGHNEEEKIMKLAVCVLFFVLMFLIGLLEYKLFRIKINYSVYTMLNVVQFCLFGSAVELIAGSDAVLIPQKPISLKTGLICLGLSLGCFFLPNVFLFFFRYMGVLRLSANYMPFMLTVYAGLFLTKGIQGNRTG